jgi:hypothetical protein
MAAAVSTLAGLIAAALIKGPNVGHSEISYPTNLRVLADKVSVPVGVVATATDYIRFGKVPKGARILPNLSLLSTNHTATVAGKLVLVPLDGVSANQEITTVVANLEATETTSIPDVADDLVVAADSYVQFVPASDLTIASTAKDFRLRLAYAAAN